MVDIEIYKNCFNNDSCSIKVNDDNFIITLMGNGDLYWIYDYDNLDQNEYSFIIDKENTLLYNSFKELYDEIENNSQLKNDLYTSVKLFNEGIITWYSDDYKVDKANSFSIEKIDENYKVTFKRNINNELNDLSIRIFNSGSRYSPYNFCFMRMYNKLVNYDYQIDMGEILYRVKTKQC